MLKLIPFEYATRNLGRSPARFAMSAAGTMLVVVLVIVAASFIRGMEQSLAQSGSANNVMLLGAGSEESIERSEITASAPGQIMASVDGIKSAAGADFVSPEVHMALPVRLSQESKADAQAVVRGVKAGAFLVHPQVRIVEGRAFNPGEDEVIVGALTSTRLDWDDELLAVGESIYIDDREMTIVGRFEAPNTVMDAEIWCPLSNLQILTRRDSLSCVVVTLESAEFADVEAFAVSRLDLELIAMRETDYYGKLTDFYKPVRYMVWATAILIALGGLFGGLNTMYAAFAGRTREVGTLQSLGFARYAIVVSFVQESSLCSAVGTLVGAVVAMALLDGASVKFSMGAFGMIVDGQTLMYGIITGLILGVLGALPPTIRCLRMPVTQALNSV
jgi:putative ABC transport system permease protein